MSETMTAPAGVEPPKTPKVATAAAGDWSDEVVEIGERIMNLTIARTAELSRYLEQVHGVKPAIGGGGGQQDNTPPPPPPPPPVEVQTEFSVFLEDVPDVAKKIGLVKTYREITALGLKESKDIVDAVIATKTPKAVKEGVNKAEAEKVKAQLEAAGGKVSIK